MAYPAFDVHDFLEKAAVLEFDHGWPRFRAETMAAEDYGLYRWEAVKHVKDFATNSPG